MTRAIEFDGVVTQGHLPQSIRLGISDALKRAEGKRVCIKLAEYRKRRSLNQNSFFHGPFLDDVTEFFNEAGNSVDQDTVKGMLKDMFGLKVMVKMPDGIERYVPKSTRDYTTMEMEDFMTKIRAWGANYGREFPLPNEDLTTKGVQNDTE